jgi:predicted DNA-binding transcriptional regulator YafY
MPVIKDANTRYRVIDKCLNDKWKRYPTIEDLADACSRVLKSTISTSTIEKDIAAMKRPAPNGYSAPIVYSKIHKGYLYAEVGFSINDLRLEEEEWEALAYAANLLYHYKEIPLFHSFREAIEKINTRFTIPYDYNDEDFDVFIQFEKGNATGGYQWLGMIYQAIKQKFSVAFQYENIYKKEERSYQIQPYLLKEHRNRWYMIGWEESRQTYLTFALDRITDANTVEKKQKRRTDFNPKLFLQHAIGIMEGDGTASSIELELLDPVDKLVLLEPLHPSQQVIKQNPRSTHVQIMVNINPELIQRILSMGALCKIKKPLSLRNIIKEELQNTLRHYDK